MKATMIIVSLFIMFINHGVYAQEKSIVKNQFQEENIQRLTTHTGPQTAADLTQYYENTVTGCGDDENLPAFFCSGVIIRATDYSTAHHSWDPSPASQSSGGVSFSYLRADSKYSSLAYNYVNGFIFYPREYTPEDKDSDIDVMCSFPIDAATNDRVDKGCGASPSYPTQSVECQTQGIFTATEWYNHYTEGKNSHSYQCGFVTADKSQYDTADGFYQSILSMAKIASESFTTQNELRLATWAQGMQDTLPIEAFFYLSGSSSGLTTAQYDQEDFYNNTTGNMWVPIIKVELPTSKSGNVVFTYSDNDQWVLQSKQ